MPTPNLNLPTIDRNMFADVPRDMNALAYAVDDAVGPNGKIALKQDLQSLNQTLINHINDNLKHPTPVERAGWNKAVVDLGNKDELLTNNKFNLVLAINELFQSSSDKNAKIAAAITDKGVPTSPTATGDQMAANIRAISSGTEYTQSIPSIAVGQFYRFFAPDQAFEPTYVFTEIGGVVYLKGARGVSNERAIGTSGITVNKINDSRYTVEITISNGNLALSPSNPQNIRYYIAK